MRLFYRPGLVFFGLSILLPGCALKVGKQPRQEVTSLYSAASPEFRQSAGSLLGHPPGALCPSTVLIRLSGEVVKRKKKLSKKYYGTSHVLSKDEAKFVFDRGCNQLIVGSGQMGNVRLSPEAEAYFAKKDCKVLLRPTPEAIQVFNKSRSKKIGLFHVTC